MKLDYSTFDLEVLRKRPTYTLPPSYHLQEGCGNGCYLDPPGFPTYFTRSVYTRHGYSPQKGPEQVIAHEGALYVTQVADWRPGDTWETRSAEYDALMRRLWKPLAIDHPRVVAWVRGCYMHFAHCYETADGSKKAGGVIVAPSPGEPRKRRGKLGGFEYTESIPPSERYRPFTYVRAFYRSTSSTQRSRRPRPSSTRGTGGSERPNARRRRPARRRAGSADTLPAARGASIAAGTRTSNRERQAGRHFLQVARASEL